MTSTTVLAAAYDAGVDEEYNRLVSTPAFKAEYQLVSEILKKYVSRGSTVYDIGSGPGRYTEFLLAHGCRVGAIDISSKCLLALSSRINGDYGENLMFAKVGCATKNHNIEARSADAVLVMGPLYHLVQKQERLLALQQANRILKPGGILISIFLDIKPNGSIGNPELLPDELVTSVNFQGFTIDQYRCQPKLAFNILEDAGFSTIFAKNIGTTFNITEIETESFHFQESNNVPTDQFIMVARKK